MLLQVIRKTGSCITAWRWKEVDVFILLDRVSFAFLTCPWHRTGTRGMSALSHSTPRDSEITWESLKPPLHYSANSSQEGEGEQEWEGFWWIYIYNLGKVKCRTLLRVLQISQEMANMLWESGFQLFCAARVMKNDYWWGLKVFALLWKACHNTSPLLCSYEKHVPSSTPPLWLLRLQFYGLEAHNFALTLKDKQMQKKSMWNLEHASVFHHTSLENSPTFSRCSISVYSCTSSVTKLWLHC